MTGARCNSPRSVVGRDAVPGFLPPIPGRVDARRRPGPPMRSSAVHGAGGASGCAACCLPVACSGVGGASPVGELGRPRRDLVELDVRSAPVESVRNAGATPPGRSRTAFSSAPPQTHRHARCPEPPQRTFFSRSRHQPARPRSARLSTMTVCLRSTGRRAVPQVQVLTSSEDRGQNRPTEHHGTGAGGSRVS